MTLVALFRGPCDSGVPLAVRGTLRAVAQTGELSPSIIEDLVLAATELVTNAVNAGARSVEVLLETPPPHLELDVTDDAPGRPTPRHPAAEDVSGRGLQIVEALADQWGYRRTSDGKTVWARFAS